MAAKRTVSARLADILERLRAETSISAERLAELAGSPEEGDRFSKALCAMDFATSGPNGLSQAVGLKEGLSQDAAASLAELVMGEAEAADFARLLSSLHIADPDEDGPPIDFTKLKKKDRQGHERIKKYVTRYLDVADIAERQKQELEEADES